jgi:hypothetical protein
VTASPAGATAFFIELELTVPGERPVEGDGRTGEELEGARADVEATKTVDVAGTPG